MAYFWRAKVAMIIHSAKYTGSYAKCKDCPSETLPEYAFAGRSNVGKSSLINMLLERKKLAKVSHTPGKTQTLNYFLVNEEWNLVDLPGYGYAKVSKTMRKNWDKMIGQYLVMRKNLMCLFVLIDSRIPPQKVDLEFINSLGERHVPFVLVFTKADKMDNARKKNLDDFRKQMGQTWETLPQQFITSSKNRTGGKEIFEMIDQVNQNYQPD